MRPISSLQSAISLGESDARQFFDQAINRVRYQCPISECGGDFGSIPIWPIGSEYRVSFRTPLTSQQLDRLAELNSLRGTVGVAFVDCELSETEIKDALAKLPNCVLFRVNSENSASAPLRVAQ